VLKTILTKGRFKVVQNAHGYIVINTHEGYEQHSHFTSIKGCKRCLMFIEKGILARRRLVARSRQAFAF